MMVVTIAQAQCYSKTLEYFSVALNNNLAMSAKDSIYNSYVPLCKTEAQ